MNPGPDTLNPPPEIGRLQASPAVSYRLGWAVIVGALLLQFWSRYLPSPWAVLVGDDWANLARSSFFTSNVEAAWRGLQDPNRPLSMIAVNVGYRVLRDRMGLWTLISLAGNSLLLVFTMKMALELTGRRMVAALTGVVFALLPNFTETYHWSTQVLNEVACALVPYALSGWMWVAYVRRGGGWRLAVSALAYGAGLFSYEAGIFLPAAYLVLLPWKRAPLRSVLHLAPIGLAGLYYLAWRATNAFGLNEAISYPTHMQVGITLQAVVMRGWTLMHWWLGERLFGAMLAGFQSYATIPLWTRRILFAANAGVLLLLGLGLRRLAGASKGGPASAPFAGRQVAGFALAWSVAAWALSLLSYTGGRLNVIPGMGVALLVALLLERFPLRQWGPVLFVPAFLALVANQGTAESFRQAGAYKGRLYAQIAGAAEKWENQRVLLIDTRSLRQRLTPGLLKAVGEDQRTWAFYGNALLLRGFVPHAMFRLATGQRSTDVLVMLDIEHGVRIEEDRLIWHERFNPSRPHVVPMQDVVVIDAFVGGRQARNPDGAPAPSRP